jgi:hypothetical protein
LQEPEENPWSDEKSGYIKCRKFPIFSEYANNFIPFLEKS